MENFSKNFEIEIPDLKITYRIGDWSFSLDPVETVAKITDIANQHRGEQGFGYLDHFVSWLKNQGVEVNRSIADFLWESVPAEYFARKKSWQIGASSSSPTSE